MVTRIPCHGFELEAETDLVEGQPLTILCHPHPAFGGRMTTPLLVRLSEALARVGRPSLRFNFRGLDGSGGVATGGSVEHEDVAAVFHWATKQGVAEIDVVGYSFGALMALRAIADGITPRKFVAIGFPTVLVTHDEARVADVLYGLSRGIPTYFVSGDADPFGPVHELTTLVKEPHLTLDLLPGLDHFFTDDAVVVDRVVRWLRADATSP